MRWESKVLFKIDMTLERDQVAINGWGWCHLPEENIFLLDDVISRETSAVEIKENKQ